MPDTDNILYRIDSPTDLVKHHRCALFVEVYPCEGKSLLARR
jgi:hypothetical protein